MKTTTLILLILFGSWFGANAQHGKVEHGGFNVMLKGLLDHSVEEVNVPDAPDPVDVIYLDAREKNEFMVSHIQNARWVGYDDFDVNRVADIDKAKKIVVYCSVGYRSEKITEKLEAAGYSDVQNLYGGIFEWVNQEHPVYVNGEATQRVHTYSKTWGIWLHKGEKVVE